ncbi:hypothetical protein CR513_21529, partial [Mucuna pruriens]
MLDNEDFDSLIVPSYCITCELRKSKVLPYNMTMSLYFEFPCILNFFAIFKHFIAILEKQISTRIKILQFEFGGEYISNEFQNFQ